MKMALACLCGALHAAGDSGTTDRFASNRSSDTTTRWAYRPLERPEVPLPRERGWSRHPIDHFVLSRLELAGLKPAGPADRITLIRRATYDLIGLPPTPDEVAAFVADTSENAFEKVIDGLLARPQYGEKWGRHWLDLVRYAETNGYERDGTKPFAWRYRDYVIQSFNDDKPYDLFVREQLAGDEMEPITPEKIIATGFYRLGLWDDEPADPILARYDELDDVITTMGQVFLATTVNCARCHDHKADPIPQTDYYRLLAFFQDIPRYGDRSISEKHVLTDIGGIADSPERERRRTELAERKEALVAQLRLIEQEAIAKMSAEDQRATEGPQRARVLREKLRKYLTAEQNDEYQLLRKKLNELQRESDATRELALSVNNCARNPPDTHVLARGNPHTPGARVQPGFPKLFGDPDPIIPTPPDNSRGSGRRRVLADWIASGKNPLTARVIANRIWQHHFGRGIVRSSSDFGKLGELPTHPQLLDWLATELVHPSVQASIAIGDRAGATRPSASSVGTTDATADGRPWTLKRMHKLIMLSNTYQMSSRDDANGLSIDPGNDLFWRFDMRRLTAEELRDSILAVNGSLNLKMGGPSIFTRVPQAILQTASRPNDAWGKSSAADETRRSIYIFAKRSLIEPVLNTFDLPDPDSSCAVRFATTVPTQSLTALNSDFFNQQAAILSVRLAGEAGSSVGDQIRMGLKSVLVRQPNDDEVAQCVNLYNELQASDGLSPQSAMTAVCLMLLNLNEFIYLD
jgi:hypothetical protein